MTEEEFGVDKSLEKGLEQRIEGEVRRRLTDRLASAGVGTDGVAREVLYLLPQEFVEAYRLVMMRALKLPGGVPGSEGEQVGVDQGRILAEGPTPSRYRGTEKGLGMKRQGGGGKRWKNTGWIVRDERWLQIKTELDRRLMELARMMREGQSLRRDRGRDRGRDTRVQNVDAEGRVIDEPPGKPWMNPPVGLESHGNAPGKAMEKIPGILDEVWGVDPDWAGGRPGQLVKEEKVAIPGDKVGAIDERQIGRSRRVQRFCTTCGKVMRNEYVRCPYHNA